MLYEWVSIGDKNSCDACNRLNGRKFEEEDLPDGSEVCEGGDRCRCTPIPVDLFEDPEVQKVLEEVADEMMKGLVIDQTSGKRIVLKYFTGIKGLGELPYSILQRYEDLITEYNFKIGTLPKKWYDLMDVNKQIEWLEDNI